MGSLPDAKQQVGTAQESTAITARELRSLCGSTIANRDDLLGSACYSWGRPERNFQGRKDKQFWLQEEQDLIPNGQSPEHEINAESTKNFLEAFCKLGYNL